jgi:hypothetical protein
MRKIKDMAKLDEKWASGNGVHFLFNFKEYCIPLQLNFCNYQKLKNFKFI